MFLHTSHCMSDRNPGRGDDGGCGGLPPAATRLFDAAVCDPPLHTDTPTATTRNRHAPQLCDMNTSRWSPILSDQLSTSPSAWMFTRAFSPGPACPLSEMSTPLYRATQQSLHPPAIDCNA